MSLPITAGGPLNVLTKPILMLFCCAMAGTLNAVSRAPAASRVLLPSGSVLFM
jgi:hypothetical protein